MAEAKVAKKNTAKLVTAHARGLHISPRKMRLVTNLVKKMPVEEAIVQLQFTNKKASGMLIKLLKSAVANAEHNFSLKSENLVIKSITCDMGQTQTRYFPRARGSAFVIRRKQSQVNVVLEEKISKSGKVSRFANFRKKSAVAKEKPATDAGIPEETTESKLEAENKGKAQDSRKTNEQIKMNKVQQKRRLFNRKTGV